MKTSELEEQPSYLKLEPSEGGRMQHETNIYLSDSLLFSLAIHTVYNFIDSLFLLSFPSYLQALRSRYPSTHMHWF